MVTAIIVAAGKSTRMGSGVDKNFLSLINKPVIAWSLLAYERCPEVNRIVLVVRKDQQVAAKAVAKMFGISKLFKIVPGGNKRRESVAAGLAACDVDTRTVVIHDGARPMIASEVISEVIKLGARCGAATVGRPVIDTLKRLEKNATVEGTEDREKLWQVQTPQAFQMKVLRDAYRQLGNKDVTDDCQAVELAGGTVKVLESLKPNFKITTPEDLQLISKLLS